MSIVAKEQVPLRKAGALIRKTRKVFLSVDFGRVSLKLSKVQAMSLLADLRRQQTKFVTILAFNKTLCLAL